MPRRPHSRRPLTSRLCAQRSRPLRSPPALGPGFVSAPGARPPPPAAAALGVRTGPCRAGRSGLRRRQQHRAAPRIRRAAGSPAPAHPFSGAGGQPTGREKKKRNMAANRKRRMGEKEQPLPSVCFFLREKAPGRRAPRGAQRARGRPRRGLCRRTPAAGGGNRPVASGTRVGAAASLLGERLCLRGPAGEGLGGLPTPGAVGFSHPRPRSEPRRAALLCLPGSRSWYQIFRRLKPGWFGGCFIKQL